MKPAHNNSYQRIAIGDVVMVVVNSECAAVVVVVADVGNVHVDVVLHEMYSVDNNLS